MTDSSSLRVKSTSSLTYNRSSASASSPTSNGQHAMQFYLASTITGAPSTANEYVEDLLVANDSVDDLDNLRRPSFLQPTSTMNRGSLSHALRRLSRAGDLHNTVTEHTSVLSSTELLALPVIFTRTDYSGSVPSDSSDLDDTGDDALSPRTPSGTSRLVEKSKPTAYKIQFAPKRVNTRRTSVTSRLVKEEATLGLHHGKTGWETQQDLNDFVVKKIELSSAHCTLNKSNTTGKFSSWRGAAILCITSAAQLLDNISTTSVNIALPHIQAELGVSNADLQWIVSAYTLTLGAFLVLAGSLSDRFGRKQVFCAGMLFMTAWTLACSFATSDIQIIIFRALQGLGAAATIPSAMGVLGSYFEGREKYRAISVFEAAGAMGSALGLVLGGLLSGTIGWRWVFRVTTPITGGLAIAAWLLFPDNTKPSINATYPPLDYWGAGLGTSSMILFTLALSSSSGAGGWLSPLVLVSLPVSILMIGAFIWVERKVDNPIMPKSLWYAPSALAIWVAGFLIYCWWSSVQYYSTLATQDLFHYSPVRTALLFIPQSVISFVVCLIIGWIVEHCSTKTLSVIGAVLAVGSAVPTALMKPGVSFWTTVFVTSVVSSIGCSIITSVLAIALVMAVPTKDKSLAGGVINTAFQIGSGAGLAICVLVQSSVTRKQPDVLAHTTEGVMQGYSAALWTSAGFAGLCLVAVLVGIRRGVKATGGEY